MSGDNYASDSKTTGDRDGSMDGSTAGAPSAPLHLLMGDDGDRLPSGPPPGRFEFLTTDKLNQHDVMCGRGGGNNDNAGNPHFRALVAERRAAYQAAAKSSTKNAIAREIVHQIRHGVTPAGRFVRRTSMEEAEGWGFNNNSDVWVLADEVVALERTKQSLRRKRREPRNKGGVSAAVNTAAGVAQLLKDDVEPLGKVGLYAESQAMGASHESLPIKQSSSPSSVTPNSPSPSFVLSHGQTLSEIRQSIAIESEPETATGGLSADASIIDAGSKNDVGRVVGLDEWIRDTAGPKGSLSKDYLIQATNIGLAIVQKCLEDASVPAESGSFRVGSKGDLCYYIDFSAQTATGSHMSSSNFQSATRIHPSSIGAIFFELFTGTIYPVVTSHDETNDQDDTPVHARKRGGAGWTRQGNFALLRDLSLPLAVKGLLADLLNAKPDLEGDNRVFLNGIANALSNMVRDPKRYLFDVVGPVDAQTSDPTKLHFPEGKLYGRDEELRILTQTFDRVLFQRGSVEALLISGFSGTGKSSLIHQVKAPIETRGGYFISGKFDISQHDQPFSAIGGAIDSYIADSVSRMNRKIFLRTRAAVRSAVGDDVELLTNLVPRLKSLIGEPAAQALQWRQNTARAQRGNQNALNRSRLGALLPKLIGAIARPDTPVLLFLDELQWADEANLELLKNIACDKEISSLLLVGCYRSNEVDMLHPLMTLLGELAIYGVSVKSIHLEYMPEDAINNLISDAIRLSPRLTQSLSQIVYQKTSGNCLFVVQFLKSIAEQVLLRYSPASRRWVWDEEAIRAVEVAGNVVELTKAKLLRMVPSIQWALKVVACLGVRSDDSILGSLNKSQDITEMGNIVEVLSTLETEGIFIRTGQGYKFSHDQIHQAAYALIPENDRPALHLQIGRALILLLPGNELDANIFTVVEQLNKGSALILDRTEKINLARLNLKAGKNAVLSSAFLAASVYLKLGISLLKEEDWSDYFELCLELYSCCAETEYAVGSYEEMSVILNEIFTRARGVKDSLRANYTLFRSFAAQGDYKNAIGTGFDVLEALGESFEKNAGIYAVETEVVQTLENLEKTNFTDLPQMTDETKIWTTRFLYNLMFYCYFYYGYNEENGLGFPFVTCRILRLTLSFGVCMESATALASFASLLCGSFGKIEEGYKVGKIAPLLLEKPTNRRAFASCYSVLYAAVNVWKEPVQACLPKLVEGYNVGLVDGEPEFAIFCMTMYISLAFHCGSQLSQLVDDAQSLWNDCIKYNQIGRHDYTPIWQCSLNLMDMATDDPVMLSGAVLDFDAYETDNVAFGPGLAYLSYNQLFLGFLFGRNDIVEDGIERCRFLMKKYMGGKFENVNFVLIEGIHALTMARLSEDGGNGFDDDIAAYEKRADECIAKMEVWSEACAWNIEHMLELLLAERKAYANDDMGRVAMKHYERSLYLAHEHGFVKDEAVAAELAAAFCRRTGDEARSKQWYSRSRSCYLKWGAMRKAHSLPPGG